MSPGICAQNPSSILAVDDNPSNLLALHAILDDLGHKVVDAASGEEALGLLMNQDFAVVLLDVRMKGLDGFETARRIRGYERTRFTPIIFMTAEASEEFSVVEAYSLGAVDYLVKPLVPVIVRAKVSGLVVLHEQKERARRDAEQLRLLIQGTSDYAIFLLDAEGRVASWNAGAERIKGYSAEEIVGQPFTRFYTQEAIDRGWPIEELRRATADGRLEDEGWRVRKDGSTFWANVIITALRDETGRLRGFSKITRDLSERKKADDALRQMQQELERRVQERTAALAASNALLKEADRRKDDFLGMLAHELRNPLSPVLTGLHVLRMPGLDRSSSDRAVGMMERQVRHMAHLVDDLLDVSRFMHGKIQLQRERVDLIELVRTTVADHRGTCDQSEVKIDVTVPETPVWASADPTRLGQIVVNLVNNACKFTPRGGLVEIAVRADADESLATIVVRDTGIGIAADLLPRIFEPFSQADRSLERSKGGLGLGLALVKGLVELHGGSVTARSGGANKGAEFIVRLPLDELTALRPREATSSPSEEQLRILIIEDNRDASETLRLFLELLGHEVRAAYTGPEGVTFADQWRPDVVLCDIGLPGLDGYGVADELRRLSVTSTARLIAITGYGSDDDKERARRHGYHAHLTKPADPELLRSLLARSRR